MNASWMPRRCGESVSADDSWGRSVSAAFRYAVIVIRYFAFGDRIVVATKVSEGPYMNRVTRFRILTQVFVNVFHVFENEPIW
jgi:hypothetical protein